MCDKTCTNHTATGLWQAACPKSGDNGGGLWCERKMTVSWNWATYLLFRWGLVLVWAIHTCFLLGQWFFVVLILWFTLFCFLLPQSASPLCPPLLQYYIIIPLETNLGHNTAIMPILRCSSLWSTLIGSKVFCVEKSKRCYTIVMKYDLPQFNCPWPIHCSGEAAGTPQPSPSMTCRCWDPQKQPKVCS